MAKTLSCPTEYYSVGIVGMQMLRATPWRKLVSALLGTQGKALGRVMDTVYNHRAAAWLGQQATPAACPWVCRVTMEQGAVFVV